MAESRDRDDAPPPDAEVRIVSADGSAEPGFDASPAHRSGGRRTGTTRRLGILLAVVAVFAFGVLVGRNTWRVQPGAATPASAAAQTGPEQTGPEQAGPEQAGPAGPAGPATAGSIDRGQPSRGLDRSSTAPAGSTPSITGRSGGTPAVAGSRFAQATGTCGGTMYVAQVGYASPVPGSIEATILAGTHPRSYDLASGTAGPPLVDLSRNEFVTDLASDEDGTVLAVKSCANPMTATIIRVDGEGHAGPIALPPDSWAAGQLVRADGRIWVALSRDRSGSYHALMATDGSGDTMPVTGDLGQVGSRRAVSPDGSRTAQVTADPDDPPGYHVKVTEVATGTVTTVPGIRLGAAGASVAFSPDSQWLVVAVWTLAGGRLLLYGPGDLRGPYAVAGTLSGPQAGTIPLEILDR